MFFSFAKNISYSTESLCDPDSNLLQDLLSVFPNQDHYRNIHCNTALFHTHVC